MTALSVVPAATAACSICSGVPLYAVRWLWRAAISFFIIDELRFTSVLVIFLLFSFGVSHFPCGRAARSPADTVLPALSDLLQCRILLLLEISCASALSANKPDLSVWHRERERVWSQLTLHRYWLSGYAQWDLEEQSALELQSLHQQSKLLITDLISLLLKAEWDCGLLVVVAQWKNFIFWILFDEF